MQNPFLVALLAGGITLAAAYLNSFLAEGYRRHRDGSSLAAGILGELSSYVEAWPMLEAMLDGVINAIDTGQRGDLAFRPIERPKDRVFDETVGKLGALGTELVEGITYVYGNIAAFRLAMEVISKDAERMSDIELRNRYVMCKEALVRATQRSSTLLPLLRARASEGFIF